VNDPKRLVEEGPTELERSLLKAVAVEQPSAEHRMRVRQAMGLGPGAAPASAATAASSDPLGNTARGGMGKMAILGVVAAGAVAAWLLIGRTHRGSPAASQPPSTPAQQEVVVAPVTPEAPGPTGVTPPTPEAPDPAAAPRAAHRATAPSASASSDIREQIRLIDEARSAVTAHDAASALRALDQYRSKFPGGALDQEATVLRIEALDQKGDHAQAASMARAFLARNPASAHAKRLERIAGQ
jgi:hypothetical protein